MGRLLCVYYSLGLILLSLLDCIGPPPVCWLLFTLDCRLPCSTSTCTFLPFKFCQINSHTCLIQTALIIYNVLLIAVYIPSFFVKLSPFFHQFFTIFMHFFESSSFPSSLVICRLSALRASSDQKFFTFVITSMSYFTFWHHLGHLTTSSPLLHHMTSYFVTFSPNFSVSPNLHHSFSLSLLFLRQNVIFLRILRFSVYSLLKQSNSLTQPAYSLLKQPNSLIK